MRLREDINRGTKGGYHPWDLWRASTVGLREGTNRGT